MDRRIENSLKKVLYMLLPNKYILFESIPDCSDNTRAVFDEMIRRGVNKEYKLVWMLGRDMQDYPKIENVIYAKKGDKNRKRYMLLAKAMICCNGFLYTDNPKQKTFFLTHGMYVKKPTSYYTLPKEIQYCFSSAEGLNEIQSSALNVDISKMIALGFPRNDVLTSRKVNLHTCFEQNFKKIVAWYPTFRQHSCGMGTGSANAVPIIWNVDSAKQINAAARERDVLIVLKPHFVQDMAFIRDLELSNIALIDDLFFQKHGFSSYEFLASCDAMISDYSSVYFDYTLCDKPIGLVWEDFQEYSENPGFALDMDYYMQGGEKIYTSEDFIHFIDAVANCEDKLQDERRKIRDISNYSVDGQNSKRVTDYILRECGLQKYILNE